MSVRDKVAEIFKELAGERAARLQGTRFLSDSAERVAKALGETRPDGQPGLDGIAFHLLDWQSEAAFLVAVALFPERFTDEEISEGVDSVLVHLPPHILEAARLGGYPAENIFLHQDTGNAEDAGGNAASPRA